MVKMLFRTQGGARPLLVFPPFFSLGDLTKGRFRLNVERCMQIRSVNSREGANEGILNDCGSLFFFVCLLLSEGGRGRIYILFECPVPSLYTWATT